MEFIDKKTIKTSRLLAQLDKFVIRFIRILEKYSDYVIISGYVSILLGRSRSTEDIDVFIRKIDKKVFSELYKELAREGFWCLNTDNVDEMYAYLAEGCAIRFAKKNETIPNFEVKFPKDRLDEETFNDMINVKTLLGDIKISSLERQIAFKKYYLKSDKDIEDAVHIESVFGEKIDKRKVQLYKQLIEKKR